MTVTVTDQFRCAFRLLVVANEGQLPGNCFPAQFHLIDIAVAP